MPIPRNAWEKETPFAVHDILFTISIPDLGTYTGRTGPERKEDNKMDLKKAYAFKTAPEDIDLARVVKEAPPEAMIVTVDWKAPGDEYPHVVALGTKRFRDACRKAKMTIPGYVGALDRGGDVVQSPTPNSIAATFPENNFRLLGFSHVISVSNAYKPNGVTHVINRVKAVMAELKKKKKSVVVSVCHVTDVDV